jgi:peptide chain release factor 1
MAIDWSSLQARYDEVSQQLAAPSIDTKTRQTLQREASRLADLLRQHTVIQDLEKKIQQVHKELETLEDASMKELYQEELEDLKAQLNQAHQELENYLYPPDERDDRSVFLEIRAGAGGQEAALFAADLMKMYTNYALGKGWQVSIADIAETDLGGIRDVTLHIEGKGVYGHLKREAGVHRVQRVPKTETQGRVHTSTATVAVLPEAEEVDVKINPSDLRIDTYRAGGAGGQHVNKTDSAVRITHIPTGVVVACQDERSQHKNKAKAMKMLQSRIYAAEREKHEAELAKERKEMVGTGMRAEKVRTYNYPQNRITDHQVDLTLKKLDIIMQGPALQEILDALMAFDKEERRKHASI